MKMNQMTKMASVAALLFAGQNSALAATTASYKKFAPDFTNTVQALNEEVPKFFQYKATSFRLLKQIQYKNNPAMAQRLEELAQLVEQSKGNLPNGIDNEINFILSSLKSEMNYIMQDFDKTRISIDDIELVISLARIDRALARNDQPIDSQAAYHEDLFIKNFEELEMATTKPEYWMHQLVGQSDLIEPSMAGYDLDKEITNFRAHTFAKLPVKFNRDASCNGSAVVFNPTMQIASSEETDQSGMLDVVKDAAAINQITQSGHLNLVCMRGYKKAVQFNPKTGTLIVIEKAYPMTGLVPEAPNQSEIIKAMKASTK